MAVQDVVGINTSHKGLSVRLLRSASLLGLLHLYRFIFVVGVLQVLIAHPTQSQRHDKAMPAKLQGRCRSLSLRCLACAGVVGPFSLTGNACFTGSAQEGCQGS